MDPHPAQSSLATRIMNLLEAIARLAVAEANVKLAEYEVLGAAAQMVENRAKGVLPAASKAGWRDAFADYMSIENVDSMVDDVVTQVRKRRDAIDAIGLGTA
jgi:hypothetical protein